MAHPSDQAAEMTVDDVAQMFGWRPRTVHRYTWQSRARQGSGVALEATDFPPPSRHVGRTPVWDADVIRAYDEARASAAADVAYGGRPIVAHVCRLAASQVRRHDVLILPAGRRVVLGRDAEGATVRLLLAARRRDPGRWTDFGKEDELIIYRKDRE